MLERNASYLQRSGWSVSVPAALRWFCKCQASLASGQSILYISMFKQVKQKKSEHLYYYVNISSMLWCWWGQEGSGLRPIGKNST